MYTNAEEIPIIVDENGKFYVNQLGPFSSPEIAFEVSTAISSGKADKLACDELGGFYVDGLRKVATTFENSQVLHEIPRSQSEATMMLVRAELLAAEALRFSEKAKQLIDDTHKLKGGPIAPSAPLSTSPVPPQSASDK